MKYKYIYEVSLSFDDAQSGGWGFRDYVSGEVETEYVDHNTFRGILADRVVNLTINTLSKDSQVEFKAIVDNSGMSAREYILENGHFNYIFVQEDNPETLKELEDYYLHHGGIDSLVQYLEDKYVDEEVQ